MVDESWNVFAKWVLVEKHISSIMCENPGEGHGLPCPPLPTPMYHVLSSIFNWINEYDLESFLLLSRIYNIKNEIHNIKSSIYSEELIDNNKFLILFN